MADHSTYLYDWLGLCDEFNSFPVIQVMLFHRWLPFIFWFKIIPKHQRNFSCHHPCFIIMSPLNVLIVFCKNAKDIRTVSYTHLRAHETPEHLVCRLLLEK